MTPTPQQIIQDMEKQAEKLWEQTMAGIQYGDSRDRKDWQEIVKKGVIAYYKDAIKESLLSLLKSLREEINGMGFADSAQAGQFAMHTDGYNQGIEEVMDRIDQFIKELLLANEK